MRFALDAVSLLLAPIVPHITEEIWEIMGNDAGTLCAQPWPSYREDCLETDIKVVVAQVNGKLRGRFEIGADADDETIKTRALEDPNVVRHMEGKTPKKVIVVKNKLVNIVV